jgi:hypothetical protein
MKPGAAKGVVLGAVALVLAGGVGFLWWNKEAGPGAMHAVIKQAMCDSLRSQTGIWDIRPEDIDIWSIERTEVGNDWDPTRWSAFKGRARITRVPFRATSGAAGGDLVPSEAKEIEFNGSLSTTFTPVQVGPIRISRPSWYCTWWSLSGRLVNELLTSGRAEELWNVGKGPGENILFDAALLTLSSKSEVQTGQEALISLFCARGLRQEGRFVEAREALRSLVFADDANRAAWVKRVESERALIRTKSRVLNPIPVSKKVGGG